MRGRAAAALVIASATLSACVTRPPTIAHVHIGHAITGVHVTPGHKGYVLVAEERADASLAAVKTASQAATLGDLKAAIAVAVNATDSDDDFGVKQSLTLAANHISFAATSADATQNVIDFAPVFKPTLPRSSGAATTSCYSARMSQLASR